MSQGDSILLKNKCVTSVISFLLPIGSWKNMSISTSCVADINRKKRSMSTVQEDAGKAPGCTQPLALPVLQVLLEFRHEPIAHYR